jgi:hypothetical protein
MVSFDSWADAIPSTSKDTRMMCWQSFIFRLVSECATLAYSFFNKTQSLTVRIVCHYSAMTFPPVFKDLESLKWLPTFLVKLSLRLWSFVFDSQLSSRPQLWFETHHNVKRATRSINLRVWPGCSPVNPSSAVSCLFTTNTKSGYNAKPRNVNRRNSFGQWFEGFERKYYDTI